ncbi:MAG: CxxxxCH/CxxCH domain-containing protein [Bacteroidales bacterium]|nr:CxxxxCH/CxxCH domain-containing protein [Bacteroidales bacterium]
MKSTKRIINKVMIFTALLMLFILLSSKISFAQSPETWITTGMWEAPAGITSVTVECWGGGSAGGGNTTGADGGGGGGGGAYSSAVVTVIPGNFYTVTVGVGGTGVLGNIGNSGGDSWFKDLSTVLAKGGLGGNPPISGAAGIAGTGGASGSGVGTTLFSGGNGGNGVNGNQGVGGGGGSSAGTGADGTDGTAGLVGQVPGSGGIAPTGGGNGGDGGAKNANGLPGITPGGAGGGAGEGSQTGGNGAKGQVILTYAAAASDCPASTTVAPGGLQTKCIADGGDLLTATITTSGGSGTPTLEYQWYYNSSDSNDPATATAVATTQTYTPLTTVSEVGGRWYFCVGYATDNSCSQTNDDQALASNTVQVDVTETPTTSNAGGPQTICVTGDVTLAANSPTAGTGAWSVISGPNTNLSQISDPASNTATFTPAGGDGSYVLRWTISNSPCTPSTSDVTITVNPEPTTSVAGSNQEICDGSGATLGANSPTDGTGVWSIVSGPSPNLSQFNNTASNTATFTPDGGVGDYVLRWTISNSPCTPSTSVVTITVITIPSTGAISGAATVLASTSGLIYTITAITGATDYTWTVPSGWTIESGQGTITLTVTSGILGEDGDITVYATNTCGDDLSPSILSVAIGSPPDCPSSNAVSPSGTQTVCENIGTSQLTASISSSGGSGSYSGLYQWYYNTSNSNTVAGATLIAGATLQTYTPLSTSAEIGDRWYFCVGYATDNTCAQTNADQSLASNAVQITVDPLVGTPGAITGSSNATPNTGGYVYSIDAVANATTYNWTVPTNWVIDSGDGTISISVTSGNDGDNGNIEVTAENPCGTSTASTKAVTSSIASTPPTITLGSNPEICQGTTSANLTYSATTESPDQYSINYDVTAEGEGFVDIVDNALPASPISLVVPIAATGATYNGVLSVKNSGSGLSSGNYNISVTVNTVKTASIEGTSTVGPNTTGYAYYVTAVPGATNYAWSVPSGWTINSGNGTENISVTTGNIGDDGNVSLIVTNSCGDGSSTNLAVTVADPTVADHALTTCSSCHTFHNATGSALTNASANEGLCLSCHVTGQMAETMPFLSSDRAIPGTSGNSHSWDVLAVNSTYETVIPTDADMVARLTTDNKIVCSTCHDQHNSATVSPYLRIDNTDDAMCKDCHSLRDVGLYTDATPGYGSHPIGNGVVYDDADARFNASPTALLAVSNNDKIQCSSCHGVHDVTNSGTLTTDGNLLKSTNDNTLCLDCHAYTSHQGQTCITCHQVHNTTKDNIYMIRDIITTPSSGDKTVVFTSETSTNSFADGDGTYDGICEVCHTTNTKNYHYNSATGDHSHEAGSNCTTCHTHDTDFTAPACSDCHIANFPNWGTADSHFAHTDKYSYECNTCHNQYGSGGALEATHPSGGSANVAIDPNGLATRNGADGNTPTWNGTTCSNIYCHSTGNSANRGTDGTYTWGALPFGTMTYATIPAWSSAVGTINTCASCHTGKGNMTAPYTITEPGPLTSTADYPATGSHGPNKGAHASNSQNLKDPATTWAFVQCFWCHETDGDSPTGAKLQGTYGTSLHVDGQTHFDPRWYSNGGTMVNTMTYSYEGSAAHCGAGKTCW